MIIFCCHMPICRVGAAWRHDNVMRPTVSALSVPWFFLTFSFGQPKEKANKKKGCRLRIRCYSGDSAGYSARKLAATRGSSDRCLTSRRPHRLRLTPRMLMSVRPRRAADRVPMPVSVLSAPAGRPSTRPKRSGVKRTTQRGRRGAAHCLSRRGRRVCAAQPEQGGSSR